MDILLTIVGILFVLWLIPILDEIRISYKYDPDYSLTWPGLTNKVKYSFILFYYNYYGFYILNPKWFVKNQIFKSKHKNLFDKPKDYIPKDTYYCRDCPFSDRERNWRFMQMNGYCHLYRIKDWWGNGFSLLWDGIKECGVNIDRE
jgi:hypothetical protein